MSSSQASRAPAPDYDFVIIGSGFGGSVSALRLTQKGYRVLLLEKGREFAAKDFPKSNWQVWRWLWLPLLRFRGLFQMSFFRHVTVLSGTGLGGGSLVYANTLPIPPDTFFKDGHWSTLADWRSELAGDYQAARTMLGAVPTPLVGAADLLLKKVATDRGQPDAYQSPHTAIFYGEPGVEVEDPYFAGKGPRRTGCIGCGACMTGCRHGAKNTLDRNYLWLARAAGLEIQTQTEVTHLGAIDGGYEVRVQRWGDTASPAAPARITAKQVVVAAGVLGTLELLLQMKRRPDGLPRLSARLGEDVRTNSEALIGITSRDRAVDVSGGVAIGSFYQIDEQAHAEMCRYGAGSGVFRLLVAPHIASNEPGLVKIARSLAWIMRHPLRSFKLLTVRDWAKSTMILLYMRAAEGTLRMRRSSLPRRLGIGPALATGLASGQAPTSYLPQASALASELAAACKGELVSLFTETLAGVPTTAHILGGCCMGSDIEHGVIDHRHQVFCYPGLYVIDGSTISANPGVNPSLTITALAERAMRLIPTKPMTQNTQGNS